MDWNELWALSPAGRDRLLELIARKAPMGTAPTECATLLAEEGPLPLAMAEPVAAATRGRGSSSILAILGVRGIMSHRASFFSDLFGTSVEGLTARFRQVRDDPAVKAIVLDVDSPGGSVAGIPELASEIYASRGSKPIVAVANTLAGSAAYWLASQADQIVGTPSSEVGSIGVYALHLDTSKMLETDGIKPTFVYSGAYKTEGNPMEPLTEEGKAFWQARVDEIASDFVAAVAKGRGVARGTVERDYGRGRILSAKAALEAGMIDRIETLDQTISRVAGRKNPAQPVAAEAPERSYQAENAAAAARARIRIAKGR